MSKPNATNKAPSDAPGADAGATNQPAPGADAGLPASGSENLNPGSGTEPPPLNADGAKGPETAMDGLAAGQGTDGLATTSAAAPAPVLGSAPAKPNEPTLTELQAAALALRGDGTPVSRSAALGWVVGKKVWITATQSYQVCPMSNTAFNPGVPVRAVLNPWMIAQVDKEIPLLGPMPKDEDDEDSL